MSLFSARQSKQADGLLDLDPKVRERFLVHMPDQREFGKRWEIRDPPATNIKPDRESMGLYCRRAFGAVSVSFEFSWFGRKPEVVRRTGARALDALLMAVNAQGGPPGGRLPSGWNAKA